ncbi:MAG: S24 family peptidase, partial [Syntrophales bacterium]
DIIIVDREGQIDNGDIVACLIDGELHLARLRKVADELWLENNNRKYRFQECQVAATVIEVIKRLK